DVDPGAGRVDLPGAAIAAEPAPAGPVCPVRPGRSSGERRSRPRPAKAGHRFRALDSPGGNGRTHGFRWGPAGAVRSRNPVPRTGSPDRFAACTPERSTALPTNRWEGAV